jgi:hypothetical protein
MSIEALIQAHTEALLANTEAVKRLTLSLAGRTPTAEKPKVEKTEAKTEVKAEEKSAADPVLANGEKMVEPGNPEPVTDEATAVPYETVRTLVLKLAPTQRDAIKALNAKHGIANLKVLLDKEDDFSTVNDQAKLEAVYADLQALEA